MNPYYMPMHMGYPPHYSYPNIYHHQMGSEMPNYKYPQMPEHGDPYQKQKKHPDNEKNGGNYESKKGGKK